MQYAYVTLLYGDSDSFIYALSLGHSLRLTRTPFDLVLMHTNDVPEWQLTLLGQFFNKRIQITDIPTVSDLFSDGCHSRFLRVFNKIHALSLTEYTKVLVCDTDLHFLRNCDELFELTAPAAVIHDEELRYTHNTRGSATEASKRFSRDQSYINAGLMLLKPNLADFSKICAQISSTWNLASKFTYPEQTFLSGYYATDWHSIHQRYNVIPNYLKRSGYNKVVANLSLTEVAIVHYAGALKPLHYLVHESSQDPATETAFHQATRAGITLLTEGENYNYQQTSPELYYAGLNLLWIQDFLNLRSTLLPIDILARRTFNTSWIKEEQLIAKKQAERKNMLQAAKRTNLRANTVHNSGLNKQRRALRF